MSLLRAIISDVDGNPSTKRVIAIWLTLAVTAIAFLRIEALATMATLCSTIYAAIVAERFGKFKDGTTDITKTLP